MKNDAPALTTHQGDAILLRSAHVQGRLEGLLLTSTLTQVFRNDTRQNLEVIYTFPLAWGAVLLGLAVTLGGKRLTGTVMARREARAQYEAAIEQGDAPVMVEKRPQGLYSASLGSLEPGEEARIELTYAQLLDFEQGRVRVVIPTTVAPRHGDPVHQGGLAPDQVADPSLLAEHGFQLSLTLAGAAAAGRIDCPTHRVSQQRQGDEVVVRLASRAWLDRDFVLIIDSLDGRSLALAGPDMRSGEGHQALIASLCPPLAEGPSAPMRLKLLVDCSGSMGGESIAQARAALHAIAQSLSVTDHVSFSRFGNATRRMLPMAPAAADHLRALATAIDRTDATMGGTEMRAALEDTFKIPTDRDPRDGGADLLLITDGEVWDAERIVDSARRSGQRVFALGVGSAPAESLLREMAEATGGVCEFVTPGEDMTAAAQRLVARIRSTRPVSTQLLTASTPVWHSPLPARMRAGETVHLLMRLPRRPDGAPGLRMDGRTLAVPDLAWRNDDLVARIVAAREVSLLTDNDAARDLAERYQLVTEHTNLLLVMERADGEKTDGLPGLHTVRPMLAAGWGGTARTAAPATVRAYALAADMGAPHPGVAESLSAGSAPPPARSVPHVSFCDDIDDEIPFDWIAPADLPSPAAAGVDPGFVTLVLSTFAAAAAGSTGIRQALRSVASLPLPPDIRRRLDEAAAIAGSLQRGWACLLSWLHAHAPAGQALPDAAAELIEQALRDVANDKREAALVAVSAVQRIRHP